MLTNKKIHHWVLHFSWFKLYIMVNKETPNRLTVSKSSTEAEYRATAITTTEITWISFVLKDLHIQELTPLILYCDNLSALQLTINPIFYVRSKQIEIDYHYIREKVALKLQTKHVSSSNQEAILLQSLSTILLKLGIFLLPCLTGIVGNGLYQGHNCNLTIFSNLVLCKPPLFLALLIEPSITLFINTSCNT